MSSFDDYREEERSFLEPGDYRVVITGAVEGISKTSGNPMIVVTVKPSGSNIHIRHYIAKNQYFNRNVTELFDSFGIKRGNFNFLEWIGAMGGARLFEDENGYLKVKWFLNQKKQEGLPPWEGEKPEIQQTNSDFQEVDSEDDLPF